MPECNSATVNVRYKDSIFRLLFSENKEDALSLYNAVNRTNYTNAEDIVINNLEDAFYLSIKNDVAFVFSKYLNLYEHQSTVNRNMPLRGLFYLTAMYRGMVDISNMYRETMVKIPTPRFVVFYNGKEEMEEDIVKLKLSDMFENPDPSGGFEWTATVININNGHNQEIMDCCKLLKEYAIFIEKIRMYCDKYINRMTYKDALAIAVKTAVDECISENILRKFLEKHKKEAIEVSMFEFSEEDYQNMYKDIGREEGLAEGMAKGRAEAVARLLQKGMDKKFILDLGYTEEEYASASEKLLQTT